MLKVLRSEDFHFSPLGKEELNAKCVSYIKIDFLREFSTNFREASFLPIFSLNSYIFSMQFANKFKNRKITPFFTTGFTPLVEFRLHFLLSKFTADNKIKNQ